MNTRMTRVNVATYVQIRRDERRSHVLQDPSRGPDVFNAMGDGEQPTERLIFAVRDA